ncbi:Lateral organ boundaries, LOB [Dillenia turbinata]|uniref:Lateral organ boundaries, LOB n=1 Tax=Dillenia turbinata TaxID=194707 RepID=A0AAN8VTU6_9MAGN
MEYAEGTKTPPITISTPISISPHSSPSSPSQSPPNPPLSPPPPPSPVILSPCAACKILRRRCVDKCVLAPYFPPTEPLKFTIAHRVFGASNIIKFLQDIPENQRADAVSSMVYEANARIRDPVYGCVGAICQLQKQVNELQAQLAKAQAEMVNMQCQQANLVALICMEMSQPQRPIIQEPNSDNLGYFAEDGNLGTTAWEPLWT